MKSQTSSLLFILAAGYTVSAQASDQALLGNSHLAVLPATAKVSEYVIITGFTPRPEQFSLHTIPEKESPSAMRIDFHPFENNFNMTASLAQTPGEEEIQTGQPQDTTYLGIGWQRLSEDSDLDLRMDLGAVYKAEANGLPGTAKPIRETLSGSGPTEDDWRPVVSIGVSYRF
ncbi:hypothetical protein [Endozoicomonas sp. OPT23]|uniref:hypothetical protein n=1 Tax=Endozoicomonas sp. OPT23 TaxID=2072845 RepID=UPI00189118B1|nr:hypothetical protein [Endozoicomonas sp. OPT23]